MKHNFIKLTTPDFVKKYYNIKKTSKGVQRKLAILALNSLYGERIDAHWCTIDELEEEGYLDGQE